MIHTSKPAAVMPSFVLRIWPEHSGQTHAWRGEVVHLQSGARRPFIQLEAAAEFVQKAVSVPLFQTGASEHAAEVTETFSSSAAHGERGTGLFMLRPLPWVAAGVEPPGCEIVHLATQQKRIIRSLADLAGFLDACMGVHAFSATIRLTDTAH